MTNHGSFRSITAISAFLSVPLAISSWILALTAVEFNPDLANPRALITLGPRAVGLLQFAWRVTDTFGYCLLLAPLAVYLWFWFQPHHRGLITLATLFGFAYIIIGSVHVALLGGAVPPLMRAYATASGPQRDVLQTTFQTVIDSYFFGIGPLTWLFGAVWWLGTGIALRSERRTLGVVTMILGGLSIVAWGEQTFFEPLAVVENLILLFQPVWVLWLGFVIARRTDRPAYVAESAPAA